MRGHDLIRLPEKVCVHQNCRIGNCTIWGCSYVRHMGSTRGTTIAGSLLALREWPLTLTGELWVVWVILGVFRPAHPHQEGSRLRKTSQHTSGERWRSTCCCSWLIFGFFQRSIRIGSSCVVFGVGWRCRHRVAAIDYVNYPECRLAPVPQSYWCIVWSAISIIMTFVRLYVTLCIVVLRSPQWLKWKCVAGGLSSRCQRRWERDAVGVEGVGNGEGVSPSPSDYGVWESVVSYPSGVRGRAPDENEFGAFHLP